MTDDANCDPKECKMRKIRGFCDCDSVSLSDEKLNLNVSIEGPIIAIANLGLWSGRRQGYKILQHNVKSIFDIYSDYNIWFSDGKNVRSNQTHHDGLNRILFRELRGDRDTEAIERFLHEVKSGYEISPQKLAAYTRSIHPYVAKVYGW